MPRVNSHSATTDYKGNNIFNAEKIMTLLIYYPVLDIPLNKHRFLTDIEYRSFNHIWLEENDIMFEVMEFYEVIFFIIMNGPLFKFSFRFASSFFKKFSSHKKNFKNHL